MTTCPKCGSNEAQALLMSVECPRCDGPADEVEEYPDYVGEVVGVEPDGSVWITIGDADDTACIMAKDSALKSYGYCQPCDTYHWSPPGMSVAGYAIDDSAKASFEDRGDGPLLVVHYDAPVDPSDLLWFEWFGMKGDIDDRNEQ